MKMHVIAILVLVGTALLSLMSLAWAQWSALSSGYAVTTNWHGQEVSFGKNVTVWAGTNDTNVKEVLFRWKRPDDSTFIEVTVSVFGPYLTPDLPKGIPEEIIDWAEANQGKYIYYANDTQLPDTIGDWGIQAFFIGSHGTTKSHVEDTIAIRATSFNVIPDLPIVGTAGALVSMLLGLGMFLKKKK